jgi:hypothetical protein
MPFLSSLDRDLEEIPVTSTPIFEGHLSVRNDKKQWQWRLFRFDGSCFTCLSTRKVKLPPHTILNNQPEESNQLSYTSPLLATPKDKNKRLYGNRTELKYYQLPEWTIDVVNISSISVLKKANKRTPSRCFSLRTFNHRCIILKAHKQKDLERWLFVLTKMWKFTQAVKNQVAAQQQQQLYNQQQVEDNIPLVHSIVIPPQQQQQQQSQQAYRPSTLSDEKIRVIEEWRKSLAELMANDPNIRISTPPPIEPIPDDDAMSVFTDMTSVSHRLPNTTKIKRRTTSKRSNPSKSISSRRHKPNSIAPQQQQTVDTRPTLKKRRSDDVRNWMNNKPIINRTASLGSSSSRRKPIIQKLSTHPGTLVQQKGSVSTSPEIIQHMNFFQDVVTVCDDDSCPYEHQQQQIKLRYHTSIKGKKLIQVNQTEQEKRPRRASMPLTDQQQQQQQQQFIFDQYKMNTLSPLQFLSFNKEVQAKEEEEEEEDMSLADLQKSLRQVSLNHHTRSPSASSIQDLQRKRYYNPAPSIVAPAIPPHQYLPQQQQLQPQLYLFDTQQLQQQQLQQKKFNSAAATTSNHTFDLLERKNSLNYYNLNNNNYVYR